MQTVTRNGLTIVIAAVLAACAAQRDSAPDIAGQPEQPVTPTPPQTLAETSRGARPIEPAKSNRTEQKPELEQVVVTGNFVPAEAQDAALPVTVYTVQDMRAASPAPQIQKAEPGRYQQITNTEKYQHQDDNPVRLVSETPVSTFSIDVDTGSYANVRRYLTGGQLPPQDAVRVEEMINYFDYSYSPPKDRAAPFQVATELSAAPWNPEALLLRVGIKGYEIPASERPAANLVFLIDVSGSMDSPDKLPLLKNAFRLLTDQLTAKDRVSMVVYAGSSGVVLDPTPGNQKHKILEALDKLEAGGSTNGAQGIKLAYQVARDAFIDKGINRVVLATDGDFNVGVVNFEALVDMAERQRESGIAITTLGFGTGNYNDQMMERIADAGNGNYAYVDTLNEARKVLVSELSSTLFTIAKDVKIQIEFNPSQALEYRLIGYENRLLAREDFNNDKVDAGDIGAGHRVTALYEVIPVGAKGRVDALRYGAPEAIGGKSDELAMLKLRYKLPNATASTLMEYPISTKSKLNADKVSTDFQLSASVAAFGQLLRGGKYIGSFTYGDVAKLAKPALDYDSDGYRREFVSLVKLAESLTPKQPERVSKAD